MAKSQVVGFDEFFRALETLGDDADGVCKMAVYEGAKIVADQVKAGIATIPVYDKNGRDKKHQGATAVEKAGLIESMGISSMQREGDGWNVTIGFDGYNSDKTAKYPNGKPNSMVARSINSGTSWLSKYPFITRAYSSSKGSAEAAMAETIEKEVQKRLG